MFEQVYDETVYIDSAIDLVQQNILVGGVLAALVLLLFLRSFSATLIVSIAIPVSVVGSFVAMALLGRSINVISLAGIAFAVGMVVDAAIVVLENIYRLRQSGHGRLSGRLSTARARSGARCSSPPPPRCWSSCRSWSWSSKPASSSATSPWRSRSRSCSRFWWRAP